MRILVTYDEMRERFRQWCELYLMCAEIQGDEDDDLDGFELEWCDIAEALGKGEDEPLMLSDGKDEREFSSIEFTDNEPFLNCIESDGMCIGISVVNMPAKETKKVVELVREYGSACTPIEN